MCVCICARVCALVFLRVAVKMNTLSEQAEIKKRNSFQLRVSLLAVSRF